jgi:hypothetical protein
VQPGGCAYGIPAAALIVGQPEQHAIERSPLDHIGTPPGHVFGHPLQDGMMNSKPFPDDLVVFAHLEEVRRPLSLNVFA